MLVNAAINPVTAILRARNGVILEDSNARALAEAVVREGVEVVNRLDIRLPSDPLVETLRVAETTRDNKSSMLQDVLNRRRTEVDYINGAIVIKVGRLVLILLLITCFGCWSRHWRLVLISRILILTRYGPCDSSSRRYFTAHAAVK
ncbi:ketopantoate reductase family protein [Vulcanisaeta sp. JCM 16159]|uniref:ketopantoate reductase family protein n=1 Tax=Vulcanisaeta sp. JCM 16159 TaxID=1295371 RepID=UPI000A6BC09F